MLYHINSQRRKVICYQYATSFLGVAKTRKTAKNGEKRRKTAKNHEKPRKMAKNQYVFRRFSSFFAVFRAINNDDRGNLHCSSLRGARCLKIWHNICMNVLYNFVLYHHGQFSTFPTQICLQLCLTRSLAPLGDQGCHIPFWNQLNLPYNFV